MIPGSAAGSRTGAGLAWGPEPLARTVPTPTGSTGPAAGGGDAARLPPGAAHRTVTLGRA